MREGGWDKGRGGERRECRSGGRVRVCRTKGGERRKCRSGGE